MVVVDFWVKIPILLVNKWDNVVRSLLVAINSILDELI